MSLLTLSLPITITFVLNPLMFTVEPAMSSHSYQRTLGHFPGQPLRLEMSLFITGKAGSTALPV